MKFIAMSFMLLLSQGAFADDLETTVRCTGKTSKKVAIGVDLQLDQIDRVVAMTTFEREATDVRETNNEQAFLKRDAKGNVELFIFRTFNDGLETNDNIVFVKGVPSYSKLELDYRGESRATSSITCVILK